MSLRAYLSAYLPSMTHQMYKVLLALSHDYSESDVHEVSKWHMKGVRMDPMNLLWDRLAVQIMRNSTASFASHVFRVSEQSRESIQEDETVRQFVEDSKRHREEVGIRDR